MSIIFNMQHCNLYIKSFSICTFTHFSHSQKHFQPYFKSHINRKTLSLIPFSPYFKDFKLFLSLITKRFNIFKRLMASSSHNTFEGVDDQNFDHYFDQYFDQYYDQCFDQTLENLSIDCDQEVERTKRKKRVHIERNREEGDRRLWNDYFSETPTFPENLFRRRFRMNKSLFVRIVDRLSNEVEYFRQKKDAVGRLSLSPLQKCTAAIRVLAYGSAADAVDEYLRLGAATARLCVEQFVEGIIYCFGDEYLRRPTLADLQRLLYIGEQRGFPGMIGNIDCMHWEWKNCPTAWKGQYSRGSGKPTIVLEAVASYDLWIWHAFFGPPGTLNDINVLDRSPVFDDIIKGQAPQVTFSVNGREYHLAYYLTDGIYPKWATFIQSIPIPQGPKAALFAQHQEAVRKDVERAF